MNADNGDTALPVCIRFPTLNGELATLYWGNKGFESLQDDVGFTRISDAKHYGAFNRLCQRKQTLENTGTQEEMSMSSFF